MSRSIDDLYDLFARFMRSIEVDMRMIRESHQAFGSELASLREDLHRHKSDVYKRIDQIEDRLPKVVRRR